MGTGEEEGDRGRRRGTDGRREGTGETKWRRRKQRGGKRG